MQLPSLDQIYAAQAIVYRHMPATPQYRWPLLNQRLGAEAWVKHENHTPVGAFKLRGALVYMNWLNETQPETAGVIAATRGNFGQGVATAARLYEFTATIVVPHGNSPEKNSAMRAQGAELIEYGDDFQEAFEHARKLAAERGLVLVESFHERLVRGTATSALELFESAPELDVVYVPVGMGSSICGMAAARNAMNLATEIVGVVAADSPAYALSFKARRPMEAASRTGIADGLACRVPDPDALEAILAHVARVITVSEFEIMAAMRVYLTDTHNMAEGAGAAALAGALQEKDSLAGKRIGIVLTGSNVDRGVYASVIGGAVHPESAVAEAAPARTA